MQNNNTISSPILVTGASGYVASHLIKLLLERGFKVRGTVRSLANKAKNEFLYHLVPEKKDNLELVEANLDEQVGWSSAVDGCEYVFHVASPIPKNTSNGTEFIDSAVNGTKYVLEACLEKGVKKIVVTSSVGAVWLGKASGIATEDDWSDEKACPTYSLSKVKAEKLVWEFYEKNNDKIQVSVVIPVVIIGPVLSDADSTAVSLVGSIMNGTFSGVMDMTTAFVDVRDVAETHFQAMFRENSNGKRYISAATNVHLRDIVSILKREFGGKGYAISEKPVSKEEVLARGTIAEKYISYRIGLTSEVSNERSVRELNIKYRSLEDTLIETANSLINIGVVPKPANNER